MRLKPETCVGVDLFPGTEHIRKNKGGEDKSHSFYPTTSFPLNSFVLTSTKFRPFWQLSNMLPAVYCPFIKKTCEGQTYDNLFTCQLLAGHEENAPRSVAELFNLSLNCSCYRKTFYCLSILLAPLPLHHIIILSYHQSQR